MAEARAACRFVPRRLVTERAELEAARGEVARLRGEVEAARAGGAAASAGAALAAAEADTALAAARAEVEALTVRLAESEAERSRMKVRQRAAVAAALRGVAVCASCYPLERDVGSRPRTNSKGLLEAHGSWQHNHHLSHAAAPAQITYEARLIEARETAAAAAASVHRSMLPMRGYGAHHEYGAVLGHRPGDSPHQQMLLAQHQQQQVQQHVRPAGVSRISAASHNGAPGVSAPQAPLVPQASGGAAGAFLPYSYPYSYTPGRRAPSIGGASSLNMSGGSFWTQPYRIESFMRDIGLPQYAAVLRSQDVTPAVLAGMRESDLEVGAWVGGRGAGPGWAGGTGGWHGGVWDLWGG